MKEKIFNLFIYTDGIYIDRLGVVIHEIDGSDEEKMEFLQNAVKSDYLEADIANVLSCSFGTSDGLFKCSSYEALVRAGRSLEVFEELLAKSGASATPLCCTTLIVNGEPKIDIIHTGMNEPFYITSYEEDQNLGRGKMADYLELYTTYDGFDMAQLMNDDYFNAIRLLFNAKHYVSCMKLIVSLIDTVSYIEFGDVSGNFVKWLTTYSLIKKLGITEQQLWEHRNSLLHMSNLDSRKVLDGKEKRIGFYIARTEHVHTSDIDIQYFNLKDMIDEIAQSLFRWFNSYNENPDKILTFIERYDRVISDSRLAIINIDPKP